MATSPSGIGAGIDPNGGGVGAGLPGAGGVNSSGGIDLGSIINLISQLGGAAGNVLSPIMQAQANKWYQGLIVNILNNLTNNQQIGQGIYGNISPQILGSLGNITGNASSGLFEQGGLGSYLNQVNNQYGNISSLFPSTFNSPTTQGATSGLQGLSGGLGGGIQQALGLLGGGTGPQQGLDTAGLSLLAAGGWTPQLNSLAGFGTNALQGMYGQGGLTPQAAAGEGVALQGLLSGGNTPYTNAMQSWGTQQATQNPLLSMTQAASFARNQAATNAMQQAEAVRARALARGGGPGAIVASGTQNQAMADFADQISQQTSGAEQNALLQQQGLGLTEQENATRLALGGAEIQNELLKTYGGILGGLSNTSANIYGTGGQQLLGASQGATSNINAGGNLIQSLLQSQIGGGNLAGNLTGTSGSLLNDILGNQIQQGQLGNQRGTSIGTLQNQTLSDYLNGLNTYSNLLQSTLNPYTSLANEGLNYSAATFGPLGNLSRANPGVTNPLAGVLQQLGLAIPGLTNTIRNIGGGNNSGGSTSTNNPAQTPPIFPTTSTGVINSSPTPPYNPNYPTPGGYNPPPPNVNIGGNTPSVDSGIIFYGPDGQPYDENGNPIGSGTDNPNDPLNYNYDPTFPNYYNPNDFGNSTGSNSGWGGGADWGGDVNI